MGDWSIQRISLRWGDVDAQGHINNAALIDYLQEARVGLFNEGPCAELLAAGIVVVSHQVQYLHAVAYDARPVEVRVGIAQLRSVGFVVAYELWQGETLCLEARTDMCPYDFQAGKPCRMSAEQRQQLAQRQVDVPQFRKIPQATVAGAGFRTDAWVRWSDQDIYRHVNNVRVFDFIQEARVRMTAAVDPAMMRATTDPTGALWLVARQNVRYRRQISYRDSSYDMHTGVVSIGRTSITLAAELTDGDLSAPYAQATTVVVCADQKGRPQPIPEPSRERLTPWLIGSDA